PLFTCPSAAHDNPTGDPFLRQVILPRYNGHFAVTPSWPDRLGLTDYLLCKGVSDSWCRLPPSSITLDGVKAEIAAGRPVPIAVQERGMFDLSQPSAGAASGAQYSVRIAKITDGTSHTMAMGEGSCGERWQICLDSGPPGQGCSMSSAYKDPTSGQLAGV